MLLFMKIEYFELIAKLVLKISRSKIPFCNLWLWSNSKRCNAKCLFVNKIFLECILITFENKSSKKEDFGWIMSRNPKQVESVKPQDMKGLFWQEFWMKEKLSSRFYSKHINFPYMFTIDKKLLCHQKVLSSGI